MVHIFRARAAIILAGIGLSVLGCSSETIERTVMVTTTVVQTATVTVTASGTETEAAPNSLRGGLFDRDVFDSDQMNQDVLTILTNPAPAGYGLTGVSKVECPERQPVEVDSSFSCSLEIDGRSTTLTVKVLSEDGQYQVNPPN